MKSDPIFRLGSTVKLEVHLPKVFHYPSRKPRHTSDQLLRAVSVLQRCGRAYLKKQFGRRIERENRAAIKIQCAVLRKLTRIKVHRKRASDTRVAPLGIGLQALLKRSRVLRRSGRWKELRDLHTGTLFYHHSKTNETQFDAPFMFMETFLCNWGFCSKEFDSLDALVVHREEHCWMCPSCFSSNQIDLFPSCETCKSRVDSEGQLLGRFKLSEESQKETPTRLPSTAFITSQPSLHSVSFSGISEACKVLEAKSDEHFAVLDRTIQHLFKQCEERKDFTELDLFKLFTRNPIKDVMPGEVDFNFSLSAARQDYGFETIGRREEAEDSRQVLKSQPTVRKSVSLSQHFDQQKKEELLREVIVRGRAFKVLNFPTGFELRRSYLDKIVTGYGSKLFSYSYYEGMLVDSEPLVGRMEYEKSHCTRKSVYFGDFRDHQRHGQGLLIRFMSDFLQLCSSELIEPTMREILDTDYIYLGQWARNVKHGIGLLLSRENSFYLGEFSEGQMTGRGFYVNKLLENRVSRCLPQFEVRGTFYKNAYHGLICYHHERDVRELLPVVVDFAGRAEAGIVCSGEFDEVHAVRYCDGDGSTASFTGSFANGKATRKGLLLIRGSGKAVDLTIRTRCIKYLGTFYAGLFYGPGILLQLADGMKSIYKGLFVNGLRHGRGVYTTYREPGSSFVLYDGQFYKDEYSGHGSLFVNSKGEQYRYEGEFRHGYRQGQGKQYYASTSAGGRCSFEGKFQKDVKCGFGKEVYRDGRVYSGWFLKGLKHGQVPKGDNTLQFPNGDMYVGEFKADKITGQGTLSYRKGSTYTGSFVDGKKHGFGKLVLMSHGGREAVYTGCFVDDKMEGEGHLVLCPGTVLEESYRGYFVKNTRHGHGEYRYSNGSCYKGMFRKNVKDGYGWLVLSRGKLKDYRGSFVKGVIQGAGEASYRTGESYTGEFVESKRHGKGKLIFPDDSCYEGTFVKDRMEGQGCITEAKTGNKYIGQFRNNKKVGIGTYVLVYKASASKEGGDPPRTLTLPVLGC